MKGDKIKKVLWEIIIVVFSIVGCNKDNSNNDDYTYSEPELISYDVSDNCQDWTRTNVSATGFVIHIRNSALFGVSKDSVSVSLESFGDTLKLTEMGYQSHFDDSICYFDISADIQVHISGTYWVQIFRGVNGGATTLDWYGNVVVSGD